MASILLRGEDTTATLLTSCNSSDETEVVVCVVYVVSVVVAGGGPAPRLMIPSASLLVVTSEVIVDVGVGGLGSGGLVGGGTLGALGSGETRVGGDTGGLAAEGAPPPAWSGCVSLAEVSCRRCIVCLGAGKAERLSKDGTQEDRVSYVTTGTRCGAALSMSTQARRQTYSALCPSCLSGVL